ncbi:MAG TPA: hypothetical protein PKZ76_11510 [Xanthomonadaceae bacterium]|nr:hypothetical protein [Xanthomonadaceae bacterium]
MRILLAAILLTVIVSATAGDADPVIERVMNATEAETATLAELDDAELVDAVSTWESEQQAQSETLAAIGQAVAEAQSRYFADFVRQASTSSELEHRVAAAVLLSLPGLGVIGEPGIDAQTLLADTLAGAALRPDLLAILHHTCGLWLWHIEPRPGQSAVSYPAGCADADLAARLTALEPSNARHWMRRANEAHRYGDHEDARAMLIASGRASTWRTPARSLARILDNALRRWPPPEELGELLALQEESWATVNDPPSHTSMADPSTQNLRDGDVLRATLVWNAAMLVADGYSPVSTLCREALPAGDTALADACRRLARMMADHADTVLDRVIGLSLLAELAPPAAAAAAAAEARLAEHRESTAAYSRDSLAYGRSEDASVDLETFIALGEVEMMQRAMARLEARRASRPD